MKKCTLRVDFLLKIGKNFSCTASLIFGQTYGRFQTEYPPPSAEGSLKIYWKRFTPSKNRAWVFLQITWKVLWPWIGNLHLDAKRLWIVSVPVETQPSCQYIQYQRKKQNKMIKGRETMASGPYCAIAQTWCFKYGKCNFEISENNRALKIANVSYTLTKN